MDRILNSQRDLRFSPNKGREARVHYRTFLTPKEKVIANNLVSEGKSVMGRSYIPEDVGANLYNLSIDELFDIAMSEQPKMVTDIDPLENPEQFKKKLIQEIIKKRLAVKKRNNSQHYDSQSLALVGPPGSVGDLRNTGDGYPFFNPRATRRPVKKIPSRFVGDTIYRGRPGDYEEGEVPYPVWHRRYIGDRNRIETQLQLQNKDMIEKDKTNMIHEEKLRRSMILHTIGKLLEEDLIDQESLQQILTHLKIKQQKQLDEGDGYLSGYEGRRAFRGGRRIKRKKTHKKRY